MIYYVSGPVALLEPGLAVIDCAGGLLLPHHRLHRLQAEAPGKCPALCDRIHSGGQLRPLRLREPGGTALL